jgi:hypothetical protein
MELTEQKIVLPINHTELQQEKPPNLVDTKYALLGQMLPGDPAFANCP